MVELVTAWTGRSSLWDLDGSDFIGEISLDGEGEICPKRGRMPTSTMRVALSRDSSAEYLHLRLLVRADWHLEELTTV